MTPTLGKAVQLGAPVELAAGEWLHTAISRWAWETFGVSRGALLDSFGLSRLPLPRISAIGTGISPEIAANIAAATGIPEDKLSDATMASLHGKLLWLAAMGSKRALPTVATKGFWSWQAGTRYCPDCLKSSPGVFHLNWRSPWLFACILHRRLLHDACPACQGALVEMRGRNRDRFDPSMCRANVAPPGATRTVPCGAPLVETWGATHLDEESPTMRAQRSIIRRVDAGTSIELLSYLQPIAIGLRAARAFEDIAQLSGLDHVELRGLLDDEKRIGVSAPRNAYAMAALVSAAFELLHTDEAHAKAIIRNATFNRTPASVPRDVGFGPGSPRELLGRWPSAPQPFRAQILRALDRDLTTGQRLLWDSAATPATISEHSAVGYDRAKRIASIPTLLWPEWCSRLDVDGPVDAPTLARSLASVVRVAGSWDWSTLPEDTHFAAMLRPNMLGRPTQADMLLAGVSELAHIVDESDVVINYPRRRELPSRQLLPLEHWKLLAESIRINRGGSRRPLNARRYLWQRITGTGLRELPDDMRVGTSHDDTAEYTMFCTKLTTDLQTALDRYGQAFLLNQGIEEPITWSPKPVTSIKWPGQEILDLDLGRLHYLLMSGVYSLRRLSEQLQVSPRRIQRAIDAAPRPAPHRITHREWRDVLPPRLKEGNQS
ncbi:TniQ family protein [Leifsonia sp. C5G2]|uniref:TniQ family protein n=1 Tax=Leifsonia sp. C5G2 TaxID=2735269 RepID=UPI001584CACB|nr:TniQ family protein [Leifsonia sp. C5G2]NUU06435.1 hypothetical protein [Leifsonia sp. C5G2]